MREVTCFQQVQLYIIQTYGTSIWWATKYIWMNIWALVLMAGTKIAPDLSPHGPFVGDNIMPSIFHLATWMFSTAQRWWHSGLCPSLCEPPQSQVYMKGDHVPCPRDVWESDCVSTLRGQETHMYSISRKVPPSPTFTSSNALLHFTYFFSWATESYESNPTIPGGNE